MSERKPEDGGREKRIGTLCKRIMKSELGTKEVKGETERKEIELSRVEREREDTRRIGKGVFEGNKGRRYKKRNRKGDERRRKRER